MIKKIILTVFIGFGIFQLINVNYGMRNEGVDLIDRLMQKSKIITDVEHARTSSLSASSSMVLAEDTQSLCKTQGFALNSAFTNEINARLPVLLLQSVSPTRNTLVYFSEVIGVKTATVEFKWFQQDVLIHREEVGVPASRWRVWSTINDLTNVHSQAGGLASLRVELWSGQCLIYRDQIPFAADEKSRRLDVAVDFFDYSSTTFSDIFNAFQYSEQPSPAPVYSFKNTEFDSLISLEIENVKRDETTLDVFSRAVRRDEALPLPAKKGVGTVVNYSDAIINRKTGSGDTVLLEAIKNKSHNTIKSLLVIGANPFIRDAEGRSPLDLALAAKDKMLAAMLVQHMLHGGPVGDSDWGYSRNASLLANSAYFKGRNRLGESALMRAAAVGDEFAIINLMGLASGEDKNEYLPYRDPYEFDYAGRQAFNVADESGYAGATFLLEQGMEKYSPSWTVYRMVIASELQNDEPLKCFIQPGKRISLVVTLLDASLKKAEVIWSKRSGHNDQWHPVKTTEYLVSNNDFQLVNHLEPEELGDGDIWEVQARIYLNGTPANNGWFVENYAPTSEPECKDRDSYQKSSLKKQFAAWVPINLVRKRAAGFSAENLRIHHNLLDDALRSESLSLMEYLIEQGMDLQVNYGRDSLIRNAIDDKKLALTQYLLTRGSDLELADAQLRKNKRSFLNLAIHERDLTMVKFLIGQGLPVNEENSGIPQPLEAAVDECDVDMVVLLLESGANPEVPITAQENLTLKEYAGKCAHEPGVAAALANY